MKLIIRYIEAKGVGIESHEIPFTGDRATIGRGTDQSIQIPDKRIPLAHSTLQAVGEKLVLKARSGCSFTLNDHISKSAELSDGDVIDILGHQIKVLAAAGDSDHLLEVDIEESIAEPLRERYTTRLRELYFPQRRLAWFMFVSIITIGILIPSTGFFVGMNVLRDSLLPDDSQWLAGELHPTHAFTGDECDYCHTEPFARVDEGDCLSCHLSVNHHFDASQQGVDAIIGSRCGACHNEHSGADSITRQDQAVCTDCHKDLAEVGLESEFLRPATDFLLDHPDFKVSMMVLSGEGQWEAIRRDASKEGLEENSNLIFPHDLHLDRDGIDSADGTVVMQCADCHVSEKGGQKIQTVTMEKHCASCHQLTFDLAAPDRVVPHGSPEALVRELQGYYAYQFLNRNLDASASAEVRLPSVRRRARQPGARRQRQSMAENIPGEARKEGWSRFEAQARSSIERRVNDAAATLFEKQTCTICHDIARDREQATAWVVKPVRLTDDWYPMAEFSHDGHRNMQCTDCHDAESSSLATDVLMPDIDSCRACHGGEDSSDRLQSTCISCHRFHLDDTPPMGSLIAHDNPADPLDRSANIRRSRGKVLMGNRDLDENE